MNTLKWFLLILIVVLIPLLTGCSEDVIINKKTNNITNNITYDNYVNITNNITYNITNNITYNITNNISGNTITKYLENQHNQTTVTPTLLPNFTTTLEANKLYEIRCRLMANTNVTANSPRFNFNITGTVTSIAHSCETATSGTARYQAGSLTINLGCLSTASIGNNVPTPFYYEGLITNDATPSNFTVTFLGETASTQYRVYEGSMCEIEKLN